MKKKSIFAILMILTLGLSIMLSACAKTPSDLEGFIKSNEDVKNQIQSEADTQGMKVDIKGNSVTYTYDLAAAGGVSEDSIKDPVVREGIAKLLNDGKDKFVESCKGLETSTGLSGISITVTFMYNDEEIATQTFTSAD